MKTPLLSTLALLALIAVLAAVGCGGGGGGGGVSSSSGGSSSGGSSSGGTDTVGPQVTGAAVSKASLDFLGGTVVISAVVTDTSGVQSVTATVKQGQSTVAQVPMSLRTGSAATYQGTFSAPYNGSESDVSYGVTVLATDTLGNPTSGIAAGTILVAGKEKIPDQPDWPTP